MRNPKKSTSAGFLIAMASYLYLKTGGILGAILFGFALSFVCLFHLNLFTGKIGWFGVKRHCYTLTLLGNIFGVLLVVFLTMWDTEAVQMAQQLVAIKAAYPWYVALSKGFFCGVLMFLAVHSWHEGYKIGCFLCVTVFILSGFEHSIADLAYIYFANQWTWNIVWIILGNALGAISCRWMIWEKGANKTQKTREKVQDSLQ